MTHEYYRNNIYILINIELSYFYNK
uniref:Uncharacterized protein n=1 Tax=Lepeophtheirus salmonis TaxID=72036 RepID=A0A0K2T149_LEPSM